MKLNLHKLMRTQDSILNQLKTHDPKSTHDPNEHLFLSIHTDFDITIKYKGKK